MHKQRFDLFWSKIFLSLKKSILLTIPSQRSGQICCRKVFRTKKDGETCFEHSLFEIVSVLNLVLNIVLDTV